MALAKRLANMAMETETVRPMFCSQNKCTAEATVRISWPGQGWVYYCLPDGQKANGILHTLGSAGAVEYAPFGWYLDGTRIPGPGGRP